MTDRDHIVGWFPNINPQFVITSPIDSAYNCIAWAAGDTAKKWWPAYGAYWPIRGVTSPTMQAFENAFATLGFAKSADHSLEPGVEKIAIYVSPVSGEVTHMARQLPDGMWTSKLGDGWDIRHLTPECLNSDVYGAFAGVVVR